MGMSIASSRPSVVPMSQPISAQPKAPAVQPASDNVLQSLEAMLSKEPAPSTDGNLGRIVNTFA